MFEDIITNIFTYTLPTLVGAYIGWKSCDFVFNKIEKKLIKYIKMKIY